MLQFWCSFVYWTFCYLKYFFVHPSVGGASFADIGEALDEIVSLSMTHDDEGIKEIFPVHTHKDMVISCCWLNIKVFHSLIRLCCV